MAKTLYVNNTDLNRDKRFSFLTEDSYAAGTTFRIQSLVGFENPTTSSGQIVLLGEIGNERSEIVKTSGSAYPSDSYKEITITGSLRFDHPQDTKAYIIDWDRADVQWSATATGSKSTIRTYPIGLMPDNKETIVVDTSQSSGFYFIRFNETIGNSNSDWSDPIPFGGFDDNSVFSIKKRAVDAIGEVVDGNVITHEFLNESLWEARREYHKSPGKRPFRRKFNTVIGTALTGSYRIELPADVEKPYGAENVYGVRIGANLNMSYYDKKDWDFDYRTVPHTTLVSAYTIGARDLYVSSARDLTDSGAISVEGTTVSYSEKSNSGGTLRISVDGSWNASAGSDVWQNATYGLPSRFTVFADPAGSAYVYFSQPIDTLYVGQNIYGDYYRTLVGYDSDADILDEPQYDMFVDYLKAKIKHRKNKGETDITKDPDYKLWLFKKNEALQNEILSTDINISPSIDHLAIPD